MKHQVSSINPGIEILIAEDSYTQAMHLKRILQKKDYQVSMTHNGEEALASIKKNRPTIVVSDVVMPEIDGYELCRQIKSNDEYKDIPVILLTTLSEPEDIIKGLECGADHFITKPYDENFLLSHIQYIFYNKELRKNAGADFGVEIFFGGRKYYLTSDRMQILDLLFSTYEAVLNKNKELERLNQELKKSLDTIKTLKGLIPICSECKKIRNDKGFWQQLEIYIGAHSDAEFTHGICPDCAKIYRKTII
jgi:two-component system response regulator VanR